MKDFVSAVIVAGGSGTRAKVNVPKQFYEILNKPVLYYTVKKFCDCKQIDEIILVVPCDYLVYTSDFVKKLGLSKVTKITIGGKTRQESVLNGLGEADEKCTFVAVHDGARPFIDADTIKNCIEDAKKHNGAAVGKKCVDTLKKADENLIISQTVNREEIWQINTPQIFKKDILLNAHLRAKNEGIDATDDCALLERMGYKIKITPTEKNNLKITTHDDIKYMEAFLNGIKNW
ncbi:MAG: 2-C-methyl-D-erythritol 4-phosphate cytidylyltransferase [Ruminococcaceae bacterium]|nr:2-C-methyl-D-erythritol 4-phosphate cytidylyltransferase [Oscillospiraceae bacterium]